MEIRILNDADVTTTAELYISIINIFDNAPTITYEGPCSALVFIAPIYRLINSSAQTELIIKLLSIFCVYIQEIQADQVTNCSFNVYHPDGILDNPFQLVIQGSNKEEELFGFTEPVDVSDGYSRSYFLVYELQYLY